MTRTDRELDSEIESHLAEATEEYIARGLSPEEARFAAMRDFGGITQAKQVHREMRRFAWLDDARQDIRIACRRLTKDRAATLISMVTLAVGIGVSSALFSVIDATMLRPLPYPNSDQLVEVMVEEDEPDGKTWRPTPSMNDMRLWQAADDVFTTVAGWGGAFRGRIVDGPQPQRLPVQHFTEGYLTLHGVTPLLGRDFVRDDCLPGSPVVALLGYGYWQSEYGGRLDVLGESVRFDDGVATIVGVLPAWFNADKPLTLPLRIPENQVSLRGTGRLSVYGRLRPDVTMEQARERLSARMPEGRLPNGKLMGAVRAVVESRLDAAISGNRTTITVLSGAVALILLIACVNVAALLLARGAAREPELAIRASLGAGRGRLVRQMLAESVVLAGCGAALGVLLAWASLDALVANMPLRLPDNSPIAVNLAVLASTAALLIPTVLLFGLLPAIRLSRARIPPALARGRQLGSPLTRRGGQWLIAAETALALVLLAGAGLMIRSFARITATDLGFEADRLITMQVLPLDRNIASHADYYTRLLQQIKTLPGISSAGLVDYFALGGGTSYSTFVANGKPTPSTQFTVMPGYLETIGARLRDGRFLSETDDPGGLRGVVINETAAQKMFGAGAAVGQTFSRMADKQPPWTVVGVIADIRHRGPIDPRSQGEAQIFFPYQPEATDRIQAMTIVMRSSGNTPRLAEQLRAMALAVGPRVLVESIRSSNDLFGERVITPKRRTVLLTLLGALGLALALVGIFGMTAYSVVRRTPEIGVRIAFGARAGQVVSTILRDAVVPIVIGTVIGLAASLLVTPVIKSFLFETEPAEPATLVSVAAILVLAGCLAAFASARRAARIDPAISLRAE
jgi:predicted permease